MKDWPTRSNNERSYPLQGHPYVNVLGVQVNAICMQQALDTLGTWIDKRDSHYVCVTPAHAVMECLHRPELYPIFNGSGLTTPDGMSIVWLLKLKGHAHVERVYGPDLMIAMFERSLREGWRHYLYGGAPGVANLLAKNMMCRFPGVQIVGTYSPPFRSLTPEEDQRVIERINDAQPDIIWVGLGTPKQECWMASHVGRVSAPVLIGVGAAFDFLSGRKRQAPRWIQKSGGEWLFRLATEPRRLWKRYAQYPLFGLLVLAQMLGLKQYPLDKTTTG
jgi:N-acetylglucosaminyldiphosphoundecaprenol N-acetyl-beta-D-mannosaminyltransferase